MNAGVLMVMIAVVFPLFWMGICCTSAQLGGWAALASRYRADWQPPGRMYHFRSARFRHFNYGGCVTIGVCGEGLYLSVLLPFRIGHAPLLIPWGEFHSTRTRRFLLSKLTVTQVGEPVVATVTLPGWIAEEIANAQASREETEDDGLADSVTAIRDSF